MRKDLLPKQLRNFTTLTGFEADEDENDEDNSGSDDDGDDEESGADKEKTENNENLKSALRKERLERKRLAREAKEMAKRLDELDAKDKSETDKAKDEASKASTRAEKLTQALKKTAVDNAIIKAGGKLKFRDIEDALLLVNREAIEVEQDDDDPSDVQIDDASVEEALKALAKKKPHLIIAEGQEDRSGSKFGGSRKSQRELDEEELRSKYPALARSSHQS